MKRLIEDIDLQFLERLRGAIDLLELLDNDRALLAELPDEERNRLHQVIAQIYNPDPVERRRKLKAAERERTAAQMERVGAVLEETGIRTLRRKPVFTTPNVFPPERFEPRDIGPDEAEQREPLDPRASAALCGR